MCGAQLIALVATPVSANERARHLSSVIFHRSLDPALEVVFKTRWNPGLQRWWRGLGRGLALIGTGWLGLLVAQHAPVSHRVGGVGTWLRLQLSLFAASASLLFVSSRLHECERLETFQRALQLAGEVRAQRAELEAKDARVQKLEVQLEASRDEYDELLNLLTGKADSDADARSREQPEGADALDPPRCARLPRSDWIPPPLHIVTVVWAWAHTSPRVPPTDHGCHERRRGHHR